MGEGPDWPSYTHKLIHSHSWPGPALQPRVEGVVNSLKPYTFDRIHGAFVDRTIWSDGKGVLERSAERYLKIIRGDGTYELQ